MFVFLLTKMFQRSFYVKLYNAVIDTGEVLTFQLLSYCFHIGVRFLDPAVYWLGSDHSSSTGHFNCTTNLQIWVSVGELQDERKKLKVEADLWSRTVFRQPVCIWKGGWRKQSKWKGGGRLSKEGVDKELQRERGGARAAFGRSSWKGFALVSLDFFWCTLSERNSQKRSSYENIWAGRDLQAHPVRLRYKYWDGNAVHHTHLLFSRLSSY